MKEYYTVLQYKKMLLVCCLLIIPFLYFNNIALAQDSDIYRAQKALHDKGYDPGPLDGIMGSKTASALRQFQKDNNLKNGGINTDIRGTSRVNAG